MFQQTELDNYKLQVELLQEKLTRSEDNRQHLEGKLQDILSRKKEHEKTHRSKSRLKYQKFLEEQKIRNDRNKRLVQMLEQIDQQAASLSARSERLKMMKIQYEMYFAKVLQSQCYRPIQCTPSMPPPPIVQSQIIPMQSYNQPPEAIYQSSRNVPQIYPSNSVGIQSGDGRIMTEYPREQQNFDYLNTPNSSSSGYHLPATYTPRKVTFEDINYTSTPNGIGRQPPLMRTYPESHTNAPVQVDGCSNAIRPTVTETSIRDASEVKTTPIGVANDVTQPISIDHTRHVYSYGYGMENKDEREQDAIANGKDVHPTITPTTIPHALDTNHSLGNFHSDKDLNDKSAASAPGVIRPSPLPTTTTTTPLKDEDDVNPAFDLKTNGKPSDPVMWNFNGRIDPKERNDTSPCDGNEGVSGGGVVVAADDALQQHSPPPQPPPPNRPKQFGKKEKMSLENIENVIYGELINPQKRTENELLEEPQKRQQQQQESLGGSDVVAGSSEGVDTDVNPNVSEDNNGGGTTPKMEADGSGFSNEETVPIQSYENYENYAQGGTDYDYQQQMATEGGLVLADETQNGDLTAPIQEDYQYPDGSSYQATDGAETSADPTAQDYQYQHQDYSNVDYQNYDQSQYQTEYDPNAYAGYTYDEQTGQYTDPNQQYATPVEGYDQSQYQPEYSASENYADYQTAEPVEGPGDVLTDAAIPAAVEEVPVPLLPSSSVEQQPRTEPSPPSPVTTPTKPSSILSTDKPGDSGQKKKKRVNFVDSETDESSAATKTPPAGDPSVSNESDFDFSAN